MNTINIFIKNSGSVAELKKDFALFAGSYQNKLIDVYVPTEILYNIENQYEEIGGEIVPTNVGVTNAVKIGAELIAPNGETVTSVPYYLNYIKKVELPDPLDSTRKIEYAVYERQLPKEFTLYAGTQTLVTNVLTIDANTGINEETQEENPPVLVQVVTTQRCSLVVQASSYISDEPVEEPDAHAQIWGAIGEAQHDIIEIQDILDVSEGESTRLDTMENAIETNSNDIAELQQYISSDANIIGQIEVVTLDRIDEALNQFVEEQTGAPAENGDVVFVILDINQQQYNYRYTYTLEGWVGYQIAQTNIASNSSYGLIKGNCGSISQTPIQANIVAGEINSLLYKNGDVYREVATDLSSVKNTQAEILNGNTHVGFAKLAEKDQNGDVIDLTYAKANDVYTKDESDDKFLPKSYSNVYYYSNQGIVDEVPTSPASGIQFTANVGQAGEVQFFDCERTLQQEYNFNKNSTDQSAFWVFTDTDCVLSFRLLTYIQTGDTNYLVSSDLTGEITFTADVPQLVNINSIYSGLGNTSLETNAGDTFRKVLYVTYVTPANNVATSVSLYSNVQYPSSFQLSTQNVNFNINVINGIAQVNILQSEWQDNGDGTYSVVINQSRHQQAPTNQYIMQLQTEVSSGNYQYIAFTPQVDLNGNITLTTLEALDCELLIASGTSKDERGILTLTNPTALDAIDYNESGALRITQSSEPTNLTLPNPTDVGVFYTFMVANDGTSTYDIVVNGEEIKAGDGIQFKWVGSWITGEEPTNTTDVYDNVKGQTLNITLSEMQSDINGLTTGKQDALTQTQLDAVNSGANATNIAQIATNTAAIATKQDALSAEQMTAVNSGVDASVVALVGTNTTDIGINAQNIALNTSAIDNLNIVVANRQVRERAYSAKRDTGLSVPSNASTTLAFGTPLYSDEDWFAQSSGSNIIMDEAHAITIKVAVNMDGQAPSAGDVTLAVVENGLDIATVTKTYAQNEDLGQIVLGEYLTSATRNLSIRFEHSFTSEIIINRESAVSVQVVDMTNKVSASDNAFDIEFGTRWVKDYARETITLK